MRIFVSHAIEDKPLVIDLFDLPEYIDPWIDIRELIAGEDLDPTIQTAIEDSHLFVTTLSNVSIKKPWIAKELSWALDFEEQKDRVFVIPLIIDECLDLTEHGDLFSHFDTKLQLRYTEHSPEQLIKARDWLKETLFMWACEWINTVEPPGSGYGAFVTHLDDTLVDYQRRLFALKAALAWPLKILIKPESIKHLVSVKDEYNTAAVSLINSFTSTESEIRWRAGRSAQRVFNRYTTFVREEVFHGTAFALNDVLESVNFYQTKKDFDADEFAAADAEREARVESLSKTLEELVEETTALIDTLKP